MNTIEMVDLYGQYLKIKGEIDEAVDDVIKTSVFIKGGRVTVFEQNLGRFLGSHVVACGNGTDALQIAFMALELNPGDEVITTPFTFVATAEVLALLGLKPVFADVSAENFNIDVSQIESAITPRTKAILPVHLFGQSADMEVIMQIARRHNLAVVEDAAQSLGAEYLFENGGVKKSGTVGTIGCTSFFPSKNLGAFGDGGALICNDDALTAKIHSIANHGMKAKYQHERVGVNSRLDSIQAAILDVKLRYFDQYLAARSKTALWYDAQLADVEEIVLPSRAPYSTHTYHQYTIRCNNRDQLKHFLSENG
ncbi:MAG: DegT/DnrJ/EryC1/StrS family aminotransferase, partial [Prolixibacteraceae bacterium]|nr:DegT/DnrJ/EryC1/StrS family aminotransferase [Prolixibacteraceae bacterium]